MLLEGTTAIVSGVGPGLGQAIATAFVREGANVTLAARNEEYLDGVATELRSNGGRVLVSPTNITDAAACSRTVERTVTEFGGIDAVVNNAFRMDPGYAFADADLERWKKIYEVNVWGSLNMTQAVIPSMRARGHGSIVFVGSMSMRKIRPKEGAYASSKSALIGAAQVLAKELGPDNIRVNTIVPGWIGGHNVEWYIEHESTRRGVTKDEIVAEITKDIPLGIIPPQEDIANTAVFFASELSAVVTGQALDVNGGEYLH